MNQSEIFNKVVILCRDTASAVAEHGQAVFNGYMSQLEVLKTFIMGSADFIIVPVFYEIHNACTDADAGQNEIQEGINVDDTLNKGDEKPTDLVSPERDVLDVEVQAEAADPVLKMKAIALTKCELPDLGFI